MNKTLVVKGILFEFLFDEEGKRWLVQSSDAILPEFGLAIMADPEQEFPADGFGWEDMQGFLGFWMDHQADLREQVIACQQILHTFLAQADKHFYTAEELGHIGFVPGTIILKKGQAESWPHYAFDVSFFPIHLQDPFEDMGSIVWRASFIDCRLFRLERDL